MPDAIAKQVVLSLTKFAGKASQLGGLGMILLGITAMALMLTIDHTLNGIWRVRRARPIAQRVLVYWAALTLGPLLVGASLWMTSYVLSASRGLVGRAAGGRGAVAQPDRVRLADGGLCRAVPLCAQHFRALGPRLGRRGVHVRGSGAGAKRAGLVPVQGAVYATIFGAFAAVPILLVWIYLSWLILLMGAVVVALHAQPVVAGEALRPIRRGTVRLDPGHPEGPVGRAANA